MNREELQQILDSGRIATVTFKKRTTGEVRVMNCRSGVKKHLKGAGPRYDAASKNLITVFDMQKGQYRSINCDSIISVKAGGTEV